MKRKHFVDTFWSPAFFKGNVCTDVHGCRSRRTRSGLKQISDAFDDLVVGPEVPPILFYTHLKIPM